MSRISLALLAVTVALTSGCDRDDASTRNQPAEKENVIPIAELKGTPGGSTRPADPPATRPDAHHESPAGVARAGEWLAPDERTAFDLDHGVTDQDGRAMKLADLRGKPFAVSFLFTRCPNPRMCPLIAETMRDLQRKLARDGLADKVRLVLITIDPVYDSPERLKEYAVNRGLTADAAGGEGVLLLRPEPERFAAIMTEFQAGVGFDENATPTHRIELILADREGRFVRDYQGAVWKNGPVLEDLRKLVAE